MCVCVCVCGWQHIELYICFIFFIFKYRDNFYFCLWTIESFFLVVNIITTVCGTICSMAFVR